MKMHARAAGSNCLSTVRGSLFGYAAKAKHRNWAAALFFAVALMSVSPVNSQTTAAGIMEGVFDVTPMGAVTYSIPIKTPPGIANVAPKISLDYNSQLSNGIAGMGWSVGGLSSIMRCPRTVATDGGKGSINYDTSDRYCLEGQKVVLTQGPAYHGAGNYYRTELDKFSRIVANGNSEGAAVSFTVESKDGLILEYGGTADSRIEASGSAAVRAWALNKVTDRKGNYYNVSYYEDGPNPQFYPSRIDFTGSAAGAPKYSIEFQYEGRPDIEMEYQVGSVIRTALRLKNIVVASAGSVLQVYRLTYAENTAALYPSRVLRIQQCDAAENCLPTTRFDWLPQRAWGFNGEGSGFWSGVAATPALASVGDLNGDGKTDLFANAGGTNWHVCLSTGSGFNCSIWQGHSGGALNNFPGDYNGDGLTDIAAYTGVGTIWQICFSTGSGFNCQNRNAHTAGQSNNITGDFDGDGRTDFAAYWTNGVWAICLSRANDFSCSYQNSHFGGLSNNILGDFNGDGKTDMAGYAGNGVYAMCLSTGVAFNCSTWNGHAGGATNNLTGDFNGDGLADIAAYTNSNSSWHICLSTGKAFDCSFKDINTVGPAQSFAADVNGDGKSDIVRYNNNGEWKVCFGTGVGGFECGIYPGHAGGFTNNFGADFNGDGKVDLAGYAGGSSWHVVLSSSDMKERIASIYTPYIEDVFSIQYKYITDNSVYTKDGGGSAAALPIVDAQYALHVVSSVTRKNGNNNVTTEYKYGGLKLDPNGGRGNLGFRWTSEKNLATGLEEYTEYSMTWPFLGMPNLRDTRLAGAGNGGLLKRISNTLAQGLGSTDYSKFAYVSQSVEESWDLNGAQFPTVVSSFQYGLSPQYGDPTQISVTTGNLTKTTIHEYWPRSAFGSNSWIIGRLKSATVTSTKP